MRSAPVVHSLHRLDFCGARTAAASRGETAVAGQIGISLAACDKGGGWLKINDAIASSETHPDKTLLTEELRHCSTENTRIEQSPPRAAYAPARRIPEAAVRERARRRDIRRTEDRTKPSI